MKVKMELTYTRDEMMNLLLGALADRIPAECAIEAIDTHGYPPREFIVSVVTRKRDEEES